jgi:predicted Zn-dependent protease
MSYHRFTADFNKEDQNRPRLVRRALKQAVSSSFFVLAIPRCTNPLCIRAYPHSLAELDNKGNEICSSCLNKLKVYQNEAKQ